MVLVRLGVSETIDVKLLPVGLCGVGLVKLLPVGDCGLTGVLLVMLVMFGLLGVGLGLEDVRLLTSGLSKLLNKELSACGLGLLGLLLVTVGLSRIGLETEGDSDTAEDGCEAIESKVGLSACVVIDGLD